MTSDDFLRATEILDAMEGDPWHKVRAILVHPDVRDEIAKRCESGGAPVDNLAKIGLFGIELLTSVYVEQNKPRLLDSDRRLLGWMDLATGQCYFAPERKPRFSAEPNFNFTSEPAKEG